MRSYFLKSVAYLYARLSSILQIKRNRYIAGIFFVFIIASICFFTVSSVSAEGSGPNVSWLVDGAAWIILGVAQICIALTVFFLRFFITLASYNNYIDVGIVQLGWTMVRDVANMFFVVALLVIAFATILGLEQYEWKKGLAKLVMMAIFINFSNLIAQLIIDIAHVFTLTFLNAISATAGGNLINMFQLHKITSLTLGGDTAAFGTTTEGASTVVFIGVLVAALFAIMAAVAMGSYVIVMAIRVVVLWSLIILSPLAYLLSAMPKGEKYAQQWWSEFSKHVIVAPVMVFFLWLAFATLGSGQILQEIQNSDPAVVRLEQSNEANSISIAQVSTWENMANYLIAFFFLMMGIKMTQETGAQGAGLVGGAVNFGKKVAMIATGYAAGRWLVGKGLGGIKDTAKDYAKIISGKTGLARIPIFGSQSAGKIRRKAALKKMETFYSDRAAMISAKGGGFASYFVPSKKSRAQMSVQKELAEREERTAKEAREAEYKGELFSGDNKKYKDLVEKMEKEETKKSGKGLSSEQKEAIRRKAALKVGGTIQMVIKEQDQDLKKRNAAAAEKGIISAIKLGSVQRAEAQFKALYEQLIKEEEAKKGSKLPLTDPEKAVLARQAAAKLGGVMETLHRENEAARPTNKFESEQKRVQAIVTDDQRVLENKSRKALRAFEAAEAAEDLADKANFTYPELMGEIRRNYGIIQQFGGQDEDKLSDSEKDILKNARLEQARALSSAYSRGYGSFLAGELREASGEFTDVDFNTPENSHILDLALLTGKKKIDFEVGGKIDSSVDDVRKKHAEIQEEMVKKLNEKGGILMRGLLMAHDKDASEHNGLESAHQMSAGVDEHGNSVLRYSNTMGSGEYAQSGDLVASGDKKSGGARRKAKQDINMSERTIKNVSWGSMGRGTVRKKTIEDATGNKVDVELMTGFVNSQVQEMAEAVGDMNVNEIAQLSNQQINAILGGDYEHSSFDNDTQKFLSANNNMKTYLENLFTRFNTSYESTKSESAKDGIRRAVQRFLVKAGVKGSSVMRMVDKICPPKNASPFNVSDIVSP